MALEYSFATDPTEAVFDYNVFDWSFDIMDVIPGFNKAIVERAFIEVAAGQAVAISINIQDMFTSIGQRFNFDPTTSVQIQIYEPDGETIKVTLANMNRVDLGFYNYQHQTLITDELGVYTAIFKAVDGTMTGLSQKMKVFKVV